MHLHRLIPADQFIPLSTQTELDKYNIDNILMAVIQQKKIITINSDGPEPLYKWDTIRPNIHMVDALLKAEKTYVSPPMITIKKEANTDVPERIKKTELIEQPTIKESEKIVPEILRPYQITGIKNIFNKWREGKRSILFQMPTGTGKTVLFNEIVKAGFEKKRKVLIVVHRIELVEQITNKLITKGINVGQIIAGIPLDYSKIVQVASIQTLSRREYPEANLIIIDECHHAKASSYKLLWDIYPDAKFLGVTATPCRLSGEGFDDLFDELIVSMSVSEFINNGFLAPVTHFACSTPDLSQVKTSKGEYSNEMLSNVMSDNSIMKDVVESYKEKCFGKSAIVFAVNIEHSKEIIQKFKSEKISAEHIDAKTPKEERERILRNFKNKIIQVVSNVEIITEGFDFPECEAVILARPTKSLSLYLQMVGRVMRPAPGKAEGLILDNAGLWKEHGLSIIDREWSLEGIKKKKKISSASEIALDKDGIIKEINRNKPNEIKGLKLVPLTFDLKRLLLFEEYAINAKFKGHKILSAYYRYLEYVTEGGKQITRGEFEYCKKRLNYLNNLVDSSLKFNPNFWRKQEYDLFGNVLKK